MAELHLIKMQGGFFRASTQADIDLMRKMKLGQSYKCKVTKERNGLFHNKAFALLDLVLKNQEKYQNITDLLTEFKLKSGHYEEHISLNGRITYIPKSIAFENMDELQFNVLFDKWVDIALMNFMEGMTEVDVYAHVDRIIGFTG